MKKLQIALETRYASSETLEKIEKISPGSKTAVFAVRKQYPSITRVRGGFRHALPYSCYLPLSRKLDPLADAQKLEWLIQPTDSSGFCNVLLFPPGLEPSTAHQLTYQYNPQWVHSITSGIERVPPLSSGSVLTNSRGIHSRRIAEFTLGLMLAMAKNIPQHVRQNQRRIWESLPSEEVSGSRVGIVGLGSIGVEIAKLCKVMGMEVWATKRKLIESEFVDHLLPSGDLSLLLSETDYVVLAAPLTEETRCLIDAKRIALMKPNACLINISRGALVDEDALYAALKNFQIRGACLDVFDEEKPIPRNSRFYQLPNLLVTSYSAYYSNGSTQQVMDFFFENLRFFTNGEPLKNVARKY